MSKIIRGKEQVAIIVNHKQAEKLTDLLGWVVDCKGEDGLDDALLSDLREAGYHMPMAKDSGWTLKSGSIERKEK